MLATRRTYTWVQKYIFPGGLLPSVDAIERVAREHAGLEVEVLRRIGTHYGLTLRLWRDRFIEHWPQVNRLGFDPTFRRMWELYLAYSEAGFRSGYLDDVQLRLTRALRIQPPSAQYDGGAGSLVVQAPAVPVVDHRRDQQADQHRPDQAGQQSDGPTGDTAYRRAGPGPPAVRAAGDRWWRRTARPAVPSSARTPPAGLRAASSPPDHSGLAHGQRRDRGWRRTSRPQCAEPTAPPRDGRRSLGGKTRAGSPGTRSRRSTGGREHAGRLQTPRRGAAAACRSDVRRA